MQHRRPVGKGSFGGHFDELVKLFPGNRSDADSDERAEPKRDDARGAHDRLFERSWRKDREGDDPRP
jgi:hypothetical protein